MDYVQLEFVKIKTHKKPKLLVVDSDSTSLLLLSCQLEDMGYEVITARNGIEALDNLLCNDIEVVLLEQEMPWMSGREVLRRMQKDPHMAQIPVIMQKDHGHDEQIKDRADHGVFCYLNKPLQREVLKSTILAALKR